MQVFSVPELCRIRDEVVAKVCQPELRLFSLLKPKQSEAGCLVDAGSTVQLIEELEADILQLWKPDQGRYGEPDARGQILLAQREELCEKENRALWTVQDVQDFLSPGDSFKGMPYHADQQQATCLIFAPQVKFADMISTVASKARREELFYISCLNDMDPFTSPSAWRKHVQALWSCDKATAYIEEWSNLEVVQHPRPLSNLLECTRSEMPVTILLSKTQEEQFLLQLRASYNTCLIKFGKLDTKSISNCAVTALQLDGLSLIEEAEFGQAMRMALVGLVRNIVENERRLSVPQFGSKTKRLGHLLNDLAALLSLMGHFEQALDAFAEAKDIFQFYNDEIALLHCFQNIAITMCSLSNYEDAVRIFTCTLAKLESTMPKNKVWAAQLLNDLGGAFFSLGKPEKALECYGQARSAFLVVAHPCRTAVLHNVGNVLYEQCKYQEALKKYNEALVLQSTLSIEQAVEKSPTVLATLQAIAIIHMDLGEFAKAEEKLEQIWKTELRLYGTNHPRLVRTRHLIASVHFRRGNYYSAMSLCDENLALLSTFGRQTHLEYAHVLILQGSCLMELEQHGEAYKVLSKAAKIQLARVGSHHASVSRTFVNMALVLKETGKLDAAMDLLEKARFSAQHVTIKPSDRAAMLFTQASISFARKELHLASIVIKQCIKLQQELLGFQHPGLVRPLTLFGSILLEQGHFEIAKSQLLEALDIGLRGPHLLHIHVAHTYHALGKYWAATKHYSSANDCFNSALKVFRLHVEPDSPCIQELIHDLVISPSSPSQSDDEDDDCVDVMDCNVDDGNDADSTCSSTDSCGSGLLSPMHVSHRLLEHVQFIPDSEKHSSCDTDLLVDLESQM